jgi:hypothetical protein
LALADGLMLVLQNPVREPMDFNAHRASPSPSPFPQKVQKFSKLLDNIKFAGYALFA